MRLPTDYQAADSPTPGWNGYTPEQDARLVEGTRQHEEKMANQRAEDWAVGEVVHLTAGPFAGQSGVVTSTQPKKVLVTALGRQYEVMV